MPAVTGFGISPSPIVFSHIDDVVNISAYVTFDDGSKKDITYNSNTSDYYVSSFTIVNDMVAQPRSSLDLDTGRKSYLSEIRPFTWGSTELKVSLSLNGITQSLTVPLKTVAAVSQKMKLQKGSNPNTVQYYLERSKSSTFSNPEVILDWGQPAEEYDFKSPDGNVYYYRSKAKNSDDVETPWSNTVSTYAPSGNIKCLTAQVNYDSSLSKYGSTFRLEYSELFKLWPKYSVLFNQESHRWGEIIYVEEGNGSGTWTRNVNFTVSVSGKYLVIKFSNLLANTKLLMMKVGNQVVCAYNGSTAAAWQGTFLVS